MFEPSKYSPEYFKVMLMGLIIECPLGGNPKDCQLYERRNLPINQNVQWVKSLSNIELKKTYLAHCECLEKKERVQDVIDN
jgi:hypothetical protein